VGITKRNIKRVNNAMMAIMLREMVAVANVKYNVEMDKYKVNNNAMMET
jgi:hypothetical protein